MVDLELVTTPRHSLRKLRYASEWDVYNTKYTKVVDFCHENADPILVPHKNWYELPLEFVRSLLQRGTAPEKILEGAKNWVSLERPRDKKLSNPREIAFRMAHYLNPNDIPAIYGKNRYDKRYKECSERGCTLYVLTQYTESKKVISNLYTLCMHIGLDREKIGFFLERI